MRFAVLSDIHGNLRALQAVLEDIGRRGVDQILCLRGLVGYGAFANEVIENIRARNIPTVRGNYDDGIGLHIINIGSTGKPKDGAAFAAVIGPLAALGQSPNTVASDCLLPKLETPSTKGIRPGASDSGLPSMIRRTLSDGSQVESLLGHFEHLVHSSPWLAFAGAFVGRALTASNPCALAMIPLTIAFVSGGESINNRRRSLSFSACLMLGLATSYTALGVLASLTGRMFGATSLSHGGGPLYFLSLGGVK